MTVKTEYRIELFCEEINKWVKVLVLHSNSTRSKAKEALEECKEAYPTSKCRLIIETIKTEIIS